MKLLILSIFSNSTIYNNMKDIHIKYLENNENNENIDYYFITFNEDMIVDVEINNNIIYIKGEENYLNILEKTIVALDYLINIKKKEYDFIIRTNVSTLFNYKLLIEYLNSIPKNNIYIGGILFSLNWLDYKYGITNYKINLYSLNNLYYFQGTSIIMSFDVINFILKNKLNIKYDIVDDVAIGLFVKTFLPNAYSRMLEIKYPKCSINNFESDSIIIRNKQNDREQDLSNMEKIITNILNM